MNDKLQEIYKSIPKSKCPDDCGKCCGILFPSLAEIRNVSDYCKQHNIEYKDFHMINGLDCPYLTEDKKCLIYPARPFLCRIMGVSDLPCPINKCIPSKILNNKQSSYLYKKK
jgi:hypothetical protein